MARPTDRNRFRKDAEAKFPIKIDVRVPAYGEPWPYVEMLAWCRDNVPAGAWAEHGFMDKKRRDERGIPIDFARFYFLHEADAEAFRRRWAMNGPTSAGRIDSTSPKYRLNPVASCLPVTEVHAVNWSTVNGRLLAVRRVRPLAYGTAVILSIGALGAQQALDQVVHGNGFAALYPAVALAAVSVA